MGEKVEAVSGLAVAKPSPMHRNRNVPARLNTAPVTCGLPKRRRAAKNGLLKACNEWLSMDTGRDLLGRETWDFVGGGNLARWLGIAATRGSLLSSFRIIGLDG